MNSKHIVPSRSVGSSLTDDELSQIGCCYGSCSVNLRAVANAAATRVYSFVYFGDQMYGIGTDLHTGLSIKSSLTDTELLKISARVKDKESIDLLRLVANEAALRSYTDIGKFIKGLYHAVNQR